MECSAALHHNKKMTNYHIHLVFSERKMLERLEVKIVTRNMFYDEQDKHRRTKKIGKNNPKEAEIRADNAARQEWNDMQELMEKLQKQTQGITEQLKADNTWEWVGRMNNIQARARKIVDKEIMYQ